MSLYEHAPHTHVDCVPGHGAPRVADQLPTGSAIARANTRIAIVITRAVGSMWCAYLFAAFDLFSLPDAIRSGVSTVVTWVAQTFLQLVLLSVIMVGQNVQADAADKRAEAIYQDACSAIQGQRKIAAHLAIQDAMLLEIRARIGSADGD